MTTRHRTRLASLAIASMCCLALAGNANAFELLDRLLVKGGPACGCGTKASHSKSAAQSGSKHASKGCGDAQACCVQTPVLDAMTGMTRSMKCRVRALACMELPRLQLPTIDLSCLLPCHQCASTCACGKSGDGKSAGASAPAYLAPTPGPAYSSPDSPVIPPPAPVTDSDA